MGHEIEVHLSQFSDLGPLTGDQDRYTREVVAHRYNVTNASRYGNTPEEIRRHKDLIARYYNALTPANRHAVDASGNNER